VVAISTSQGAVYDKKGLDIGELIKLYHQAGSQAVKLYSKGEQIDKSLLAELDVDIFSPCAQSHSIALDNARRMRARIVCPGANAPVTPEAELELIKRGILYVPDFTANCGGVLGISMKRAGLKEDYIRRFLRQNIEQKVTEVIEAAQELNITPKEYAERERVAEDKFLKAKAGVERKNITSKVFSFALELYRRGLIPYQLVTPFATRYFDNRLRKV
jgi:glutamate dehydrogenase/leucine dehydrogenase